MVYQFYFSVALPLGHRVIGLFFYYETRVGFEPTITVIVYQPRL